MTVNELLANAEHEQVVFCRDAQSGLNAIIAIHSTLLGPSLGGARMYPYPSFEAALEDVLRLSRGMTYKAAAAGLDIGGGKAVIIGDPATRTPEQIRAFARYVNSLGGRYLTATDVGLQTPDLDLMREETTYVTGVSRELGGGGDTSILTALTVFQGMRAAVQEAFGTTDMTGVRVAVQGLGKVGGKLLKHLKESGATIAALADSSPTRTAELAREYGGQAVAPDAIYDADCDVFSPNALGAVLNDETIPRIKAKVICGGANNQLAEDRHGEVLRQRGVVYAPDYLVNSGGIINIAAELEPGGYDSARAEEMGLRVFDRAMEVFRLAREHNESPAKAADRMVEQRLAAARDRGIYWPWRQGARAAVGN
ncbi:MAG: Glu/Leu/Phe/Val dehydrogenase dimerization domain-containing protein [Dehalococcoidia bacterium]